MLGLKAKLSTLKCGHHVGGYTLHARLENQTRLNVVSMWVGTHYMLGFPPAMRVPQG